MKGMLKKSTAIAALCMAVACTIALAGCKVVSEPEPIAVQSVTLNATTLTLAPGDTRKLTATVNPENADDKTVIWLSSDTAVATVDDDGAVKAIKEGTATITAQAGVKKATCEVTVKLNPIAVESVTLDVPLTLTLVPGATRKLTATVNPGNADDKAVTWSSSDTAVAVVGSDGTVVAIKDGTAIITAQAGGKTAICVVTVKEDAAANPDSPVVNPNSPVAVESVTLNAYELTIEPGKTKKLQATVMPSNANDKTVTWSSSNTSVATVDDDGTVTAHEKGTATIYAYADGKEAACMVTVKTIDIPVEDITLDEETTLTLWCGDTGFLRATVTPYNADDKTVLWTSSNPSVATVTDCSDFMAGGWGWGEVTAVNAGTAIITAQAGDKKAECVVTVEAIYVESVTLDRTTLTLMVDGGGYLMATVTPLVDVPPRLVIWSSSNPSVASVENNGFGHYDDSTWSTGYICAKSVGTALITVQVGDKTAFCGVTVNPVVVTSVILDAETFRIKPGATRKLTATVDPVNAEDRTVTWSSSDTAVATVDSDGTVTALKEGMATITAHAGGKEAKCEVTVSQYLIAVESVYLSSTTSRCKPGNSIYLRATVTPDNADDTTVTWSSSDTSVATVDSDGTVTALKEGTATITASAGGKTATCTVTVVRALKPITYISLVHKKGELKCGAWYTILIDEKYPSGTDDTLVFSSSNDDVATVDSGGRVTGVNVGKAIITVQADVGDAKATYEVTVVDW